MDEFELKKLSTIQKRNNLNGVYRYGDAGPGGAWHDYYVISEETGCLMSGDLVNDNIMFQKGPRNEPLSQHGVLDTDLLEIVRDRLTCFQAGEYACRENAIALTHIEEALLWMNKRVEDRAERNVLGTYEK